MPLLFAVVVEGRMRPVDDFSQLRLMQTMLCVLSSALTRLGDENSGVHRACKNLWHLASEVLFQNGWRKKTEEIAILHRLPGN